MFEMKNDLFLRQFEDGDLLEGALSVDSTQSDNGDEEEVPLWQSEVGLNPLFDAASSHDRVLGREGFHF